MKTKFALVANHLAYGDIVFVIEAEDSRAAFRVWKQVVGRPNQWIVRSNAATRDNSEVLVSRLKDAGYPVDPEFA